MSTIQILSSGPYGYAFIETIEQPGRVIDGIECDHFAFEAWFTVDLGLDFINSPVIEIFVGVYAHEDEAIEWANDMLRGHYEHECRAEEAHTSVHTLWDKMRALMRHA